MKSLNLLLVTSLLTLAACGGTGRPVYSGHEENTKGVPGFTADGKKTSRYVKLGQSYSVDGETYVPRYEPGYTEEGLASWYGPGFHGGRTANGEEFDKHALTAAHRTLPLPSMVKVTLLETGKSVIVRINDRGPFAKGRIIDLSYGAADKIGLLRKGTAKVRVEYLDQETKRFNSMLADGRDPTDIDVDREVLGSNAQMYASNGEAMPIAETKPNSIKWYDHLNPISSARASEPAPGRLDTATYDAADAMEVTSSDLAAPVNAQPAPAPNAPMQTAFAMGPFSGLDGIQKTAPAAGTPTQPVPSTSPTQASAPAPAPAPAVAVPGQYFQLGAFANQSNAERLRDKVATVGTATIEPKSMGDSSTLYVVRMGPYADVDESARVLAELNGMGINPKTITK